MASPDTENKYRLNVGADAYAARHWDLATHFSNEDFARSGAQVIVPRVAQSYPQTQRLDVFGLASGTAFYEQVLCAELHDHGFKPELTVVEMQADSVKAIPRTGVNRIIGDVTYLPLPEAGKTPHPRLIVSRAIEHYFSPGALAQLTQESARLLRPGEMYFPQLSSGDEIMLKGFRDVLQKLSGKDMQYFTVENYTDNFISAVTGIDGQPLFQAVHIGNAHTPARGPAQFAMRYLNENFLQMHAHRLTGANLSYGDCLRQTHAIAAAEDALAAEVKGNRMQKDEAVLRLEQTIRQQPVYDLFRQISLESATATLKRYDRQGTRNLRIIERDGKLEPEYEVEYPVVQLTRTTSPIPMRKAA